MKAFKIGLLAVVATVSLGQQHPPPASDKARLIGAWHLVSITGPDGKAVSTLPSGMLVYTSDGHMSVQLMYPKSQGALTNEYVQSGYEASFGSYEVNEAKHLLTHYVQGSVTRDALVGKDLPHVYQFKSNGQLTIKSARSDEHWSVTWEHY